MAHSTTSSRTHQIVKYSASRTPLPATAGVKDIQWKHHQGEHLRLTLDITTTQTTTPPGATTAHALIRYGLKISYLSELPEETQSVSQNVVSEVVFENLDLSCLSGLKYHGRELPLKAIHKNRTVAFRYLHPQTQNAASPQTYRRFQVTFSTEAAAVAFVESIQLVCPFNTARDVQSQASQTVLSAPRPRVPASALERSSTTTQIQDMAASTSGPTSSSRFSSTLPRSATTYHKKTMFDDPLSSPSLGELASSQNSTPSTIRSSPHAVVATSSPLSRSSGAQRVELYPDMAVISGSPSSDRDVEMHSSSPLRSAGPALGRLNNTHHPSASSSLAYQAQLPPSQSAQAPINGTGRENERDAPVPGHIARPEQDRRQDTNSTAIQAGDLSGGQAGGISDGLLAALRQGDSDIYNMSFEELRQVVAEVIREPKFPELVGRVHKMWKEQVLVGLNIAPMNQ
ncbi:hypothetical protein BDV93DRAFT_550640 [Ceratobasidium sp. AG-I]|nr:hypothetical protein BDV93DRAFT_550640 [Ceratobasidium sp. AG-I]